MVMPPGAAGTYRIHFTGSKEHNVRLRERARDMGWSLSEKGFLRIGEGGEPLSGDDAELRTFATEDDAYAFLGLPFIEPELREDHGEIEAAGGPAPRPHPARGPHGRPPQPFGLVGRDAQHRGHGRSRPPPRSRLPGPHRPQPVARDRVDSPRTAEQRAIIADLALLPRRGGRRSRPDAARGVPPPHGCGSRSAQTASSITQTTCWPSTWSSPRSTFRAPVEGGV